METTIKADKLLEAYWHAQDVGKGLWNIEISRMGLCVNAHWQNGTSASHVVTYEALAGHPNALTIAIDQLARKAVR